MQCRQCGQWVLQGYDADVAAVMVEIDPQPISLATESALHAYKVSTYSLQGGAIHWRWTRKWGIPPVSSPWGTIHAVHRCETPKNGPQSL